MFIYFYYQLFFLYVDPPDTDQIPTVRAVQNLLSFEINSDICLAPFTPLSTTGTKTKATKCQQSSATVPSQDLILASHKPCMR